MREEARQQIDLTMIARAAQAEGEQVKQFLWSLEDRVKGVPERTVGKSQIPRSPEELKAAIGL